MTWCYHILRSLVSLGIDANIGVFLQNFLSNRTFCVKVDNSFSDSFSQYEGVPQGCVLNTVNPRFNGPRFNGFRI